MRVLDSDADPGDGAAMRIELEHRRRLHEVPGATATPLAANAFEVSLPRDDDAVRRSRRPWSLEGWDGAVLVLDGRDAEPAVACGIDPHRVRVTVYLM